MLNFISNNLTLLGLSVVLVLWGFAFWVFLSETEKLIFFFRDSSRKLEAFKQIERTKNDFL